MMERLSYRDTDGERSLRFWTFLLFGAGVLIYGLVILAGGDDVEDRARRSLETQGYAEVKTTGHSVWSSAHGCSDSDSYAIKATAKNPRGQPVHVTVCCGAVLKSCTVRAE